MKNNSNQTLSLPEQHKVFRRLSSHYQIYKTSYHKNYNNFKTTLKVTHTPIYTHTYFSQD